MAAAGTPGALSKKYYHPFNTLICIERLIPRIKSDTAINFELPEGRINTGENMLQITDSITDAVACGRMTIEEAEKFNEFLKQQRYSLARAENAIQEEVRKTEWSNIFKE